MTRKPRAVFVLTSSMAPIRMLSGQCRYLREHGFDVTVVSDPGPELDAFGEQEGVRTVGVRMVREPSPWRDLVSLRDLWRIFRELRPDLVGVGTPKAGLLGGLAALFSGVPVRLYTLHGLRAETAGGLRGVFLRTMERMTSALAHAVVCVSSSLRARAVELRTLANRKGLVLGAGSANGLRLERYPPVELRDGDRLTIGFVGRLTADKGIAELVAAYDRVRLELPETRLLLVGDFEDGDPLPGNVVRRIRVDPAVEWTGFVDDPTEYYRRMDVFALPSRREGLPQVVLEASASALPVVACRATGCVDAVIDGETGLLTPVDDPAALANALIELLRDPERRGRIGAAGRLRVEREFCQQRLWESKAELWRRLIERRTMKPMQRRLKRLLDLGVSATLLVLLAPVMAATAAMVRLGLGSPVLFRQRRPGLDAAPFEIVKFRSMTDARDASGELLPDELRLMWLGRFLRRWSLDELPQLWNVLKGEMSLVGPRPLLWEYLERYTPEQARRHTVPPGITGWAQIQGRNRLDWERRFELDVWYVDNWSLGLDLAILAMTATRVLLGADVFAPAGSTPPAFEGSNIEASDRSDARAA